MKLLVGIAVLAALLWLAASAVLWWTQESFLFPAPRYELPEPPRIHLERDGVRVPVLWHPPEAGEATVIRFHGNGDSLLTQARVGEALRDRGFGVLVVGYRGYPGATGPADLNRASEAHMVADGLAAFDWARERTAGPIAVYGHSLGAGVAAQVAARRPVSAAVLESPFLSMRELVAEKVPWVPVGLLLRHPMRSDLAIPNVDAPVLVVHGGRDGLIPPRHGQALAALAKEGTFVELPEAGHNDLIARGSLDRAVRFLEARKRRPPEGAAAGS